MDEANQTDTSVSSFVGKGIQDSEEVSSKNPGAPFFEDDAEYFEDDGSVPEGDAVANYGRIKYWFAGCKSGHTWRSPLTRSRKKARAWAKSHNYNWRAHGAKVYFTYREKKKD